MGTSECQEALTDDGRRQLSPTPAMLSYSFLNYFEPTPKFRRSPSKSKHAVNDWWEFRELVWTPAEEKATPAEEKGAQLASGSVAIRIAAAATVPPGAAHAMHA